MFRANRIGTPNIHQAGTRVQNTTNPALNTSAAGVNVINGHQVNAVNLLDFGFSNLEWFPAVPPTLADNTQVAFGNVVTMTPAIAGDAFGFELTGSIRLRADPSLCIVPFFASLSTITGTVLGNIASTTPYAQIAPAHNPNLTGGPTMRSHYYQTQVVHNTAGSGIVIAHGFILINNSGAGRVLTAATFDFSVRQLNDQQSIAYRDTRR